MGEISQVKDPGLAKSGRDKISLAKREMPVLNSIADDFRLSKPFAGLTIGACLHVTKETGVLVETLVTGGARVFLCGSNPLSTQDDVAAALASHDSTYVFAWRGMSSRDYRQCLNNLLDFGPQLVIDDGADLISLIHSSRRGLLKTVFAGQEETTTGVTRLKAMARENKLEIPIVAVNDTPTKRMFDNYYGTGQSTMDALMRTTNILLPGKVVVVSGYGFCGKGIAKCARGMGARVVVTEVDSTKSLQAIMDGHEVVSLGDAAKLGDVFITATGNKDVITVQHMELMKDGVILGNAGHFNVEIDVSGLMVVSFNKQVVRANLEQYTLKNGRKIYLIAEGRLMNLVAAEGHPSSVMDMSFANQALVCQWLAKEGKSLEQKVHSVPEEIDKKVARLKLDAMGIKIDILSDAQVKYLSSWQTGI